MGLGLNCIDEATTACWPRWFRLWACWRPSGQGTEDPGVRTAHPAGRVVPRARGGEREPEDSRERIAGGRNALGSRQGKTDDVRELRRRPRSPEEARARPAKRSRGARSRSRRTWGTSPRRGCVRGDWSAAGWCANELDEAMEEMDGWPELVRFADLPKVTMRAPGPRELRERQAEPGRHGGC